MDVRRAHQQWLMDLRRIRADSVAPRSFFRLQQSRQSDIVLGHDAIQHVVRSFGVGQRQLVEFNQVIVNQWKPVVVIEEEEGKQKWMFYDDWATIESIDSINFYVYFAVR